MVGGAVAGIITSKWTRFAAPPIFGREDRAVLGAPRQEPSEPSASRWLTRTIPLRPRRTMNTRSFDDFTYKSNSG
jgi:hypothetical protein